METPTSSFNRLDITRVFKADIQTTYSAWTDAEALKQWMGCCDSKVIAASVDLSVGGEYSITFQSNSDGEVTARGTYLEIDEPNKLVFTWLWSDGPLAEIGETTVTVAFEAVEGGTKIHLGHEAFISEEIRDGHNGGWNDSLGKLDAFLNQ